MAIVDKERVAYAVKALEWTGNNLELVEQLVGVDVIRYDRGDLYISGTFITPGDNIIATVGTDYDAGPPEVTFVPGTFIEVVTDAVLATKYQDPA